MADSNIYEAFLMSTALSEQHEAEKTGIAEGEMKALGSGKEEGRQHMTDKGRFNTKR